MFWFARDDSIGDFVSELFEPIANNRVTISAFFGESLMSDDVATTLEPASDETTAAPPPPSLLFPVHPVTLTGGSIFYSNKDDQTYVEVCGFGVSFLMNYYFQLFEEYVTKVLFFEFGFEHRPNVLSVSTEYNAVHTINVDPTVFKLYVAADSFDTITLQKAADDLTKGF